MPETSNHMNIDPQNYYQKELARVNTKSIYSPQLQVKSGDGSGETKWMSLNNKSAAALKKWLEDNYNV